MLLQSNSVDSFHLIQNCDSYCIPKSINKVFGNRDFISYICTNIEKLFQLKAQTKSITKTP